MAHFSAPGMSALRPACAQAPALAARHAAAGAPLRLVRVRPERAALRPLRGASPRTWDRLWNWRAVTLRGVGGGLPRPPQAWLSPATRSPSPPFWLRRSWAMRVMPRPLRVPAAFRSWRKKCAP